MFLIWDIPLYAMNMFLLPLVNREAALVYGRAGNPGRDREGKKVESRICHVATEGERCQNITGKSQSRGNM